MGFLDMFKKKKNVENNEQNNVPQIPSFANINLKNQDMTNQAIIPNNGSNNVNRNANLSAQNQVMPSVVQNVDAKMQKNVQPQSSELLQLPQQPTSQSVQSIPSQGSIHSSQTNANHLGNSSVSKRTQELQQSQINSKSHVNSSEVTNSFNGSKYEHSMQLSHHDLDLHKQVFYENGGLFMDYITYSDFNKSLDFSKNTIVGLKKAVDFFLNKSEFESLTSDYTKLIDDMNRTLLKIDKKLFND